MWKPLVTTEGPSHCQQNNSVLDGDRWHLHSLCTGSLALSVTLCLSWVPAKRDGAARLRVRGRMTSEHWCSPCSQLKGAPKPQTKRCGQSCVAAILQSAPSRDQRALNHTTDDGLYDTN